MEAKELRYAIDVMADYGRVLNGTKPLLIVSEGKSTGAYETVAEMVGENPAMSCELAMFRCEDGKLHEHAFVCRAGSGVARWAADLLFDRAEGNPPLTRVELQRVMGALLGYSLEDITAFIFSPTGMNCPCDCCGGPVPLLLTYQPTPTLMPRGSWGRDAQKARMLENCYQF